MSSAYLRLLIFLQASLKGHNFLKLNQKEHIYVYAYIHIYTPTYIYDLIRYSKSLLLLTQLVNWFAWFCYQQLEYALFFESLICFEIYFANKKEIVTFSKQKYKTMIRRERIATHLLAPGVGLLQRKKSPKFQRFIPTLFFCSIITDSHIRFSHGVDSFYF